MPNENLARRMQTSPDNMDQPENAAEFYKQSFSEVLMNNIGVFVTCEFLIGTGSMVEKTGVLYGAGVNFVTLYDDELERYITCDLYSLKFVTFYDTRPGARGMQIPPQMNGGNGNGYPPSQNSTPRHGMNGRG